MLRTPRLLAALPASRQGAYVAAQVVPALTVTVPLVAGVLCAHPVAVQRQILQGTRLPTCMLLLIAHVSAVVPCLAAAAVHDAVRGRLHATESTVNPAAMVGAAVMLGVCAERTAGQQALCTRRPAHQQRCGKPPEVLRQGGLQLGGLWRVLDGPHGLIQPCKRDIAASLDQGF